MQLAYLYLTLAHSKGQRKGHVNFCCECLEISIQLHFADCQPIRCPLLSIFMLRDSEMVSMLIEQNFRRDCTAAVEQQIERLLFDDYWNFDNVVWIRRSFRKLPFETADGSAVSDVASLSEYFDVAGDGVINEHAQGRLKNLAKRLNTKMVAENRVEYAVAWSVDGVSESIGEHEQYLRSLEKRCAAYLEELCERIVQQKQEIDFGKIKMLHRGALYAIFQINLSASFLFFRRNRQPLKIFKHQAYTVK